MKRIFIIHSTMEIGGAETSLLGLLNTIDYNKYKVDLMLLNPTGELIDLIPMQVNILPINESYLNLILPIKNVMKRGRIGIGIGRIIGKIIGVYYKKIKKFNDICYITKQYSHKISIKFLPEFEGYYDLGISFIDPHYILGDKVNAKVKLGWLHTDFSRIDINTKVDYKMWNRCDYIISVSDKCKDSFDEKHPSLRNKSIVIENILSKEFIINKANENIEKDEIKYNPRCTTICSVGRFSEAKNFDNIPSICRQILNEGINIKWYIIGYGSDEEKIRKKIIEEKVSKNVIMLGKKMNPYPYINACDIYIQPSRYEGKAVTVREAQILNKPVIITNFKTSTSQLQDGVDGIIVPMDNEGCADGIISLIKNEYLKKYLIDNTMKFDYSNKDEIEIIYKLMGD